jgi:hypothetical protein
VTHTGWGADWSANAIPEESPDDRDTRRSLQHKQRRRSRHLRRNLRRILFTVSLLLALAIAAVAWVGVDALKARAELKTAAGQVHLLQAEVQKGDREGAKVTLASMQQHADMAQARTHGAHWSAVRVLPWIGPNVKAVQTVSEVIDGLAVNALPTLMDATSLVDPTTLAPVNGRVDLKPLVKAEPKVVAANAEVLAAAKRLGAINPKPLLAAVAAPLADLRTQVGKVALTTATAARAVRLLPPMLGAVGPREYLLLVQNNAEQRATGGIPGSVILLRAVDGAVKVVEQRAGNTLGGFAKPVLPLTAQEHALFGDDLGAKMLDVTFTPDFPRSGQLAREIWKQKVGGNVDGVLSIDPGALADVLGATGPVKLPTGQQLTESNAVQLLLNTVYIQIADPKIQDQFFAATAGSVFDAMLGGQGKPAKVVDALAQAAREGRLMVWSARKDEQALLSGTVLSGELVGVQDKAPVIGVYLNDGSAAKIGYYLRTDVVATPTGCRPDRAQTVNVKVTLTNTAPADAAGLPPYLTGGGDVIPAGQVRTNVLLYAPSGGRVDDVRASSGDQGVFSQVHNGLAVVGRTVQLKPGQQIALTYDILTGPGQPDTPVLRVTPVALGRNVVGVPSQCS